MKLIAMPSPEGTTDNSPELQLWVEVPKSGSSPSGATECRVKIFSVVPSGLEFSAAHGPRAEALGYCRSPLAGLKMCRRWFGIVCGLAIGVCVVPAAHAQSKAPATTPTTAAPLTEQKVIERVTASVDRSLEYLASKQKPDGSWDDCNAGNALTILAMLGRGHVPGRGQYKEVLQKGRKYLLKTQREDGLFHSRRQAGAGPMYEHGLSTLATAELYGMDPDPDVEEKLRRAVKVIINAQSPNGGWRYNPKPGDHDLSVSVMQIVALRAANNAEIPVPEEVIEKAAKYVRYCAHPNGGYGYQGPAQGAQTSAAGVVSLQLLGKYDDPSVPKTLDLLAKFPVEWSANGIQYWYYFHYYAIQANYQAGGKHWNDWHPRVRELLLDKQNADGSWDVPGGTAENAGVVGPNNIYWTGMASLILEVYMHFLPAYQR